MLYPIELQALHTLPERSPTQLTARRHEPGSCKAWLR